MPRLSSELAAANQRTRDVRNELFKLEQETVVPLRAKIAELERANARLIKAVSDREHERDVYKDAWRANTELMRLLLDSTPGDRR